MWQCSAPAQAGSPGHREPMPFAVTSHLSTPLVEVRHDSLQFRLAQYRVWLNPCWGTHAVHGTGCGASVPRFRG